MSERTNTEYILIALIIVSILVSALSYSSISTIAKNTKDISALSDSIDELSTDLSEGIAEVSTGIEDILTKLGEEPIVEEEEEEEEPTPLKTDEVTFSWSVSIPRDSLDPSIPYSWGNSWIFYNCYDRLVTNFRPEFDISGPQPMLAERWDASPDAKIWTFYLREDVKFHSGNPLTADDVKWTFDKILQKSAAPSWMFSEVMDENSVTVLDDYTVEFNLTRPCPWLLGVVGTYTASIQDSKLLLEHEQEGDLGQAWLEEAKNDAGSGPFTISLIEADVKTVLSRYEDYFKGPAKLSKVTLLSISESLTAQMMLEKGDIDMMLDLTPENYEVLMDNPDINMLDVGGQGFTAIWMNVASEHLQDPRVRLAIKKAINKKEIDELLSKGLSQWVGSAWCPGVFNWDEEFDEQLKKVQAYDIEGAKQLLSEAGYADGFEISISCTSGVSKGMSMVDLAVKIQSDLAAVGITATVKLMTAAALSKSFKTPDYDLLLRGVGYDFPDPHNLLHWVYNSANKFNNWIGGYQNELVDNLTDQAALISDPDERKELYNQVLEIVSEEDFALYLWYVAKIPMNKNIHGCSWSPGFPEGGMYFYDVYWEEP